MRKLLLISFTTLLSLALWAENSVTGLVMDKMTRQAIDFANVSLHHPGDNVPLSGTTTEEDGSFLLAGMANGTYELRFSFTGYNPETRTVTLKGEQVNVGKIYLEESSEVLQEVEVVGQGTTMRFELDKKIFTVDQNIAASGGSITDALEQVPAVDVDQEGNISLRNSESVEIWINGKPAGLTAENRADVLKQMPAESIKEIEVITNPSAKYSPEGTAGIINLVMKKDRKAGYFGSVSGTIDYCLASPWTTPPGGRVGVNFNFNKGIVSGYFNVGYHYHSSNGETYSDRYNYYPTDTTRLIKQGQNNHRGGGMFLRGGLDFRVTDRSTLGVSGFGMVSAKNDKTGGAFSSVSQAPTHYTLYDVTKFAEPQSKDNEESILREYDRDQKGTGNHPGGNVMLHWLTDFTKQHKLMVSAQYAQFSWNGDNLYIERENGIATTQEQLNENLDRSVQLKADYEWKPTEQSRLEAGWQTDLAWRSTLADAWDCADEAGTRTLELTDYYNDFRNNEQTHALYITYGNRFWNKFAVQVGVRGEYFKRHIVSDYYDALGKATSAAQDTAYFQVFPSVYLSYDFGHGHELQVNYTRRIDRPRGHQINPRQDLSDPTNIRYGNPYLLPQYSSAVELNYLKNWERHVLSAGLFYRFADDVHQNIQFNDGITMRNTFINAGRRHEAGVEVVVKNRLFGELLQLTTSANFYYNRLDRAQYTPVVNGTELDPVTLPGQNTVAGSVRLNANFMFTKTFSGQLSGRYRSPHVTAQGKTDHSYSLDIGLRKTFLDRRLALAFNVRDILNSRARRRYNYGDGFWQYSRNRWNSRVISLTLTYNFGNMKPKRNETYNANSNDSGSQYEDMGTDE